MNIKPFEQVAAELATLIGLHVATKTAADVAARAVAAMKVAAVFTALANSDAASAQAALLSIIVTTTDPGEKQFLTDLLAVGSNLLQVQIAVNTTLPILGTIGQGIAGQFAAGVTAIASKYVPTPSTVTATPVSISPGN